MTRIEAIEFLENNGFTVTDKSRIMTRVIMHRRIPEISIGFLYKEEIQLRESIFPPNDNQWTGRLSYFFDDDLIRRQILHLKALILTQDTRMRRQRVENMRQYFRSRDLIGTGQGIML